MPVPYVEQSSLARIVLTVSVGAFVAGELSQGFRVRRGASRVDLRAEVVFRAMFLGGILVLPIGRAVTPGASIGGGAWVFGLGAALAWLGMLVRWWSFATLGALFTVVLRTSEDQPVVDRGPYRVLRHPGYSGLLLAFAGCGVMLGNWGSTAGALVVVLVALVHRIRVEERALIAALGDRYRDFAAGRARLIPYVW